MFVKAEKDPGTASAVAAYIQWRRRHRESDQVATVVTEPCVHGEHFDGFVPSGLSAATAAYTADIYQRVQRR